MRIAYLDCFSGMSGDMFLGALIDAGVSSELLEKTVAALDVGARLEISKVNRGGIAATKVDVLGMNTRRLVDIRTGRLTCNGMRATRWLRGQERPRRMGTVIVIRSAAG
jgi:uncharacterized protein (DUF111 family)